MYSMEDTKILVILISVLSERKFAKKNHDWDKTHKKKNISHYSLNAENRNAYNSSFVIINVAPANIFLLLIKKASY